MTSVTTDAPVLLGKPAAPAPPPAATMVRIAREFGVSPLRQIREMVALRRGPGTLAAHEYVSTGAFRPENDMTAKREFVGLAASHALNLACSPLKLIVARGFVRDKALFTQLLRSVGIQATETQGLVHKTRQFGDVPALRDMREVAAFLLARAQYPIFGKPVEGTGSVGSVLITDCDAKSGLLQLGNGQRVDLEAFAQEIVRDYPQGYLFQTAIAQHADVGAITGLAVGTVRLVTLRDAGGIKPLYGLWKIPAPQAMSDNYWQDGSMIAELDEAGQVQTCWQGNGPDHREVASHPVSDKTFAGFNMPHWSELREAALQAHGMFPQFGVIGWDIAIGADGPVIVEANDTPFHGLYQLATGRGVNNASFRARFDAAAEESQRMLSAQ